VGGVGGGGGGGGGCGAGAGAGVDFGAVSVCGGPSALVVVDDAVVSVVGAGAGAGEVRCTVVVSVRGCSTRRGVLVVRCGGVYESVDSVEPSDPGCVGAAVDVVPGSVKFVVVSAFVAVMPTYAVVVSVVVVAVSPGAPSVPVTPLAEPSGTTLYCCCSRWRLSCFLLHPANARPAASTTATFLIFMTTFCCLQVARYMPEQPLKSRRDVNCHAVES
jgi:hypothetical protein